MWTSFQKLLAPIALSDAAKAQFLSADYLTKSRAAPSVAIKAVSCCVRCTAILAQEHRAPLVICALLLLGAGLELRDALCRLPLAFETCRLLYLHGQASRRLACLIKNIDTDTSTTIVNYLDAGRDFAGQKKVQSSARFSFL